MAKKAVKRAAPPKRAANTAAAKKAEAAKKKASTENDDKSVEKTDAEQVAKTETEKVDNKTAKDEHVEAEKADDKEKSDEPETELENAENEGAEDETENKEEDDAIDTSSSFATATSVNQENPDESIEEADHNDPNALNILIGEDEENLLLNSGDDEHIESKNKTNKANSGLNDSKDNANEETEKPGSSGEQKDQDKTDKKTEGEKTDAKTEKSNESSGSKDDEKNKNKIYHLGRSLWITNLLPSIRAQELQHLLSRYGKVIGAKIVQSPRHPRTRCYGYVTMESRAAADHCIKKLNNTELTGQIIRVAKVRPEHSLPGSEAKDNVDKTKLFDKSKTDDKDKPKEGDEKQTDKKPEEKKDEDKQKKDDSEKKKDEPKNDSKERDAHHSQSGSQNEHSEDKSVRRDKKTDVLTFDKIREERDRNRARERERALREDEKRRRDIARCREIERKQQSEARRLEREREKLRMERERLDKQRQEILRIERDRQKLEREKLEREKEELRRQQMRLEEARRPVKRPAATSASNYRREAAGYPDDRKREAREDRHYEEAPPPPRFDVAPREPTREVPKKDMEKHMSYSKHSEDYRKRDFNPTSDRHYSGTHMGPSNGSSSSQYVNRDREIREPRREPIPPSGPQKIQSEVRYNERNNDRSPVPYRGPRDERERRPLPDHHGKPREHRYGAEPNPKESGRFREGNSWHGGGPSPPQPFLAGPNGSSRDSWSKSDAWRPLDSTSERWVGNSSSRLLLSGAAPGALYSSGNSSGLSCPPPPGSSGYSIDRFENYKSLSTRKY